MLVEHPVLACVCKSYAFVGACCLLDQSSYATGDVVSCILAALSPGEFLFLFSVTVFDWFAVLVIWISLG